MTNILENSHKVTHYTGVNYLDEVRLGAWEMAVEKFTAFRKIESKQMKTHRAFMTTDDVYFHISGHNPWQIANDFSINIHCI